MPTEEQTYRESVKNQLAEIAKTLEVQTKMGYSAANSLSRLEIKTDGIEKQATFTNGKVRKMIVALVLIAGIVIGQSFTNVRDIIALFTHLI